MFASLSSVLSLFARLFFMLAVLQLGACGFNLGGPQSAAVKYVKNLVEQPDGSPELANVNSKLLNHVVIEYARALHKQGVAQKYRAEKLGTTGDSIVTVAVSIIPDRDKYVAQERSHTLILEVQKSKDQGWKVINIKTRP
jgi:hypothetical protein